VAFKNILLHMDDTRYCTARLDLAITLARHLLRYSPVPLLMSH
jgi:hypothetical protein